MENNKNKKSVKFQGDMLNYCDFIQVFVFTSYHHLNVPGSKKLSKHCGHLGCLHCGIVIFAGRYNNDNEQK